MFPKLRKIAIILVIICLLYECILYVRRDSILLNLQFTSSGEEAWRLEKDNGEVKSRSYQHYPNDEPPDFEKVKTLLLFIGYPRSGSTLIGSILDAHKHIVIANEYNLLAKWKYFTTSQKNKAYLFSQLWNNSVTESNNQQRAADKKFFFHYHIPGLWQGRYKGAVKIIGDKKSTTTTRALAHNKSNERFIEILSAIKLPVKFIHLIRNPFDNIATMTLRARHPALRMKAEADGLQLNSPIVLMKQTEVYLNLVDMNNRLRKQYGKNVLDIHYSSFIRQPKIWLKTICDFLQVECDEYYLNACVNVIFKNETYTRRHIVWPESIKTKILEKIESIDFLNGLQFEIE